ncbi:MAG: hypothetical protein UU10_C0011G0008 [Parcubacteria group bacterium GW2011_GWF1_40_6]|uniref:Uncharacterized protein n=2 Tax=Candidatus Nomuraibacteriota TaxID=1752729 RepID=A0A0G0QRZ0_9BACT|nr:MAG: hypothetical protein UT78_C0012G0014 [Candidatus Nomurabacteria bacterium GW2011_GWF2_40_12]KKR69561.1 MAG: hypothetical protein UU10_C0011G0008 [Parcubacteria group bacterium GW2011_GWF1_40_6]OGJ09777.1 MAG: hypothetical protein A2356_02060 [Candidatus Nomurabacteria bacterium RIFOXYB1_FULL_39_16]OGJ15295.1 MAG: hypothetical protein A2585_03105 [Candidatus Nomurabacteria bacterium RIFOXYD1_FULL_39_12]
MERIVNFWEIFRQNPDGGIEPTRVVRIGGVQMGPGVVFGPGVSFGGVNLAQYAGRSLRIQEDQEIITILGIL